MFFKIQQQRTLDKCFFFLFLVFVCAENKGSDYRLYIVVSDLFLEKRSEKILVLFFNLFFISFILSPIIHVFLPAAGHLLSLSFLLPSFFSSSYFVILFSPLFLCFCFVVILHLLSEIISAFYPLFLSLDQFVFLSFCNFLFPLLYHCSCFLSFFLSFFLYPLCINSK